MRFNSLLLDWVIPLTVLIIVAPFTPQLDLALTHYFYNPASNTFSQHFFFTFFYLWGLLPGQILGLAALAIFLLSFCVQKLHPWRKPALHVGLTITIGAGLITHALLKDHWKRPRPKQVEQFGGTESFKPFYQPNLTAVGHFKSFPSGHSAMGFCFFALAIQARRRKQMKLFIASIFLAIILGVCLSMARIAQGGHFFSDTLFSACLMWITAATCDWLVYRKKIVPVCVPVTVPENKK